MGHTWGAAPKRLTNTRETLATAADATVVKNDRRHHTMIDRTSTARLVSTSGPIGSPAEPTSRPAVSRILRSRRERIDPEWNAVELSSASCEARLLARHPALDATFEDLCDAKDFAPVYSTPGVRYRTTVPLEDIGHPILWAHDLASLKQVLSTVLLLPWDDAPSIPGMYRQMLGPMSEAVKGLLTAVSTIDDFTPEFLSRLDALIPHRRIEWIGTLRDLAHGECETARELRYRYFLETGAMDAEDAFADTPGSVPPIPVDENERFLEFLREYPVRRESATA
jgi:hypothetical protein